MQAGILATQNSFVSPSSKSSRSLFYQVKHIIQTVCEIQRLGLESVLWECYKIGFAAFFHYEVALDITKAHPKIRINIKCISRDYFILRIYLSS